MKINMTDRVCMEPKVWFWPDVPNPNHLNLDNILRFFDILTVFFTIEYVSNLYITFIICAETANLSQKNKNKIFSAHVSKLGHLKKRQKHINDYNLLSFYPIFMRFSGMITVGKISARIQKVFNIYISRMRSAKSTIYGLFIARFPRKLK